MYIYQNLLKMRIIVNLIITAAVAYFLPKVLSGVHFLDFSSAVIFAVVLGLLNIFLKPILNIISFPVSLVTFGLFCYRGFCGGLFRGWNGNRWIWLDSGF